MNNNLTNHPPRSLYDFWRDRYDSEFVSSAKIEEMLYRPDDSWEAADYIDHIFRRMERDICDDPDVEDMIGSRDRMWRLKKALKENVGRITARYFGLKLWSPILSFFLMEFGTVVSYDDMDCVHNYTRAAALWILDEIYMSGKMYELHRFLPQSSDDITDEWAPFDFYHPCYSNELINSVAQVVGDKSYARQFRGIIGLLDQERVEQAVEQFRDLQLKAIDAYMKAEEYLDRRLFQIAEELSTLRKSSILSVADNDEKRNELAAELKKLNDERCDFRYDYWKYFGNRETRVMKRRRIAEFMKVEIEDPYEVCFAAVYMTAVDDPSTWLEKIGCAVLNAACRMLPWYGYFDDYEDENFYDEPAYDTGGWLEQKQPQEAKDLYHQFDKDGLNKAQRIYRLSKGIVPSGKHPFEQDRIKMKEDGLEDADDIARWSEILFLSKTRCDAVNFLLEDWDDDEEEEPDDYTGEHRPLTRPEHDAGEENNNEEELEELRRKLAEVQRQNKSLRAAISETRKIHEAELDASEKELKTLRMAHRELADLRELVFSQEHEQQDTCVLSEPDIQFPYTPNQKTVMFGGHESFLKEFRKRLPCVTCVSSKIYSFDPNLVRYADVVWIQTNSISHPQYWKVIKTAKAYGVQIRYFTYSSAEKCAVQLAEEDKRHNL